MQQIIDNFKEKEKRQLALDKQIDQVQERIRSTPDWKEWEKLKEEADDLKDEIDRLKNLIRQIAIDYYKDTGEKKPHPGIQVIIKKKLTYKDDRAIRWAVNNDLNMLKLLRPKFEKHARAVSSTVPLIFVTIEEEPAVRISSKL